ncbi:MAG: PCRF domain-containing protein, partial [Actinomycetes bacterium]
MATGPNLESAPQRLSAVTEQLSELSSFLDPDELARQVAELEARMGAEGFWDNQDEAARVSAEHARVSRRLERWQELSGDGDDLATMLELVDEDSSLAGEFEGQLIDVERRLAAFEEERLFAGDYDAGDALVTVNAGAGGTDAQDWAEMVLRMMMRWAESRGF